MVHVVTTTQELHHSTRNFVRLEVDYLGDDVPLSQDMATWPNYIDRFNQNYYKAFAGDPLFGSDIVDNIHKWVQVFLQSCNMTCLDNVGQER